MSSGLWAALAPAVIPGPSPTPSPSPSSTSEPSPSPMPVMEQGDFVGATSEQMDQLLSLVVGLGSVFAVGLAVVIMLLAWRALAAEG